MKMNKVSIYLRDNIFLIEPFVSRFPKRKLVTWPQDWNEYLLPLFKDQRIIELMNEIKPKAGYSPLTNCKFQIIKFIQEYHNEQQGF